MNLLKEGVLEVYKVAKEAIETLPKELLTTLKVEKLTPSNIKGIDGEHKFIIKSSDGIGDVVITMFFFGITWRRLAKFREYKRQYLAILLTYFPKARGDITEKINKLLKNENTK